MGDIRNVGYYTPLFIEIIRVLSLPDHNYLRGLNIFLLATSLLYLWGWWLLFSLWGDKLVAAVLAFLVRGIMWPPGFELWGIFWFVDDASAHALYRLCSRGVCGRGSAGGISRWAWWLGRVCFAGCWRTCIRSVAPALQSVWCWLNWPWLLAGRQDSENSAAADTRWPERYPAGHPAPISGTTARTWAARREWSDPSLTKRYVSHYAGFFLGPEAYVECWLRET